MSRFDPPSIAKQTGMVFVLSQAFSFDAAHTLTRNVPLAEYDSSRRVHGHTFTAEVAIKGPVGADGMLQIRAPGKRIAFSSVDLYVLQMAIAKTRAQLDHRFLDEVEGLGPATLENLCRFIAADVGKTLPVHCVTVSRAAGDSCRLYIGSASSALSASDGRQEDSASNPAALHDAVDGEGSEL
jgi:6-pyruvoyltetrahydropterin/6-carboxytetrahydropterin synthase